MNNHDTHESLMAAENEARKAFEQRQAEIRARRNAINEARRPLFEGLERRVALQRQLATAIPLLERQRAERRFLEETVDSAIRSHLGSDMHAADGFSHLVAMPRVSAAAALAGLRIVERLEAWIDGANRELSELDTRMQKLAAELECPEVLPVELRPEAMQPKPADPVAQPKRGKAATY